jgi:serine/threonine-protein kinase
VVYRAFDDRLEREVALKFLSAAVLADEQARRSIRAEALALSHLNHPHICTVYEIGETGGQTYIAMEYVEGRPLSDLARHGGGLSIEAAGRYAAQIAGALAHAHERGVLHRDLKSSNVIITPDGRAKVLDFGLARSLTA